MQPPYIVNIVRMKNRRPFNRRRTSILELSRIYFKKERVRDFLLELLLFAVLTGISAWPVIHLLGALRTL